jgi:AraC-like DNA-binding protein
MQVCQNPIFIDRLVWRRILYFSTIRRAVEYLSDHLDETVTLRTIADVACMERTAFSKAFKRRIGLTLHEFVQAYRMSEAALRIETSDCSITEIALQVGYSSAGAFDKAFKKVSGTTPLRYRTKLLMEGADTQPTTPKFMSIRTKTTPISE